MKKNRMWLTVLPVYIFTILFVSGPLVYGFILSFLQRGSGMQVNYEFTLDNYKRIWEYKDTILLSLKVGVTTTVITALIGYPFGYMMARLKDNAKSILMILVVIPFWTSSLLRLSGWVIMFKADGILETILKNVGVINESLKLLYNYNAVISGMVYMLLPFMILSVYSAVDKMNFELLDAAYDLGASKFRAFWTITFRMTISGLTTGILLTFIPSMGLFFVAERLGGNKIYLMGNLIKDQITSGRNLPFGAALAVGLTFITTLVIGVLRKMEGKRQ